MIFVGYSATSRRAYRFWNPLDDFVVESSNARFDEAVGRFNSNMFPHYKPSLDVYLDLQISYDDRDYDDSQLL